MARERYAAQVSLLVSAIPIVGDEPDFALKGGTAISRFPSKAGWIRGQQNEQHFVAAAGAPSRISPDGV